MKLAIADPPYPPALSERHDTVSGEPRVLTRSRATRWYGGGASEGGNHPADNHPAAAEWDDPARHRQLVEQLLDEYDGWAIATSPDGLAVYEPLPIPCRRLVWRKLRPMPTGHRIATTWEPVIVYPPIGRRSRTRLHPGPSKRYFADQVPDFLEAAPPASRFAGAKPAAWTRWVLDALGHDPETDTVADLFPGSGAVAAAAAQGVLL